MIYPNSRSLHLRPSKMESNHAMPLRKLFPSSRLGSYVAPLRELLLHHDSYRYPEMIDLHTENLASELLSSDSPDIQDRLNKQLRSFTNGEIPNAAGAISALFGILARYSASTKPIETGLQAKPKCTWVEGGDQDTPPHRRSMNIALIKSMHRGSFLDMEYRVKKQRSGTDQFASIYLCSTVLHSVRSNLLLRGSCSSYPLCVN